MVFERLTNKLIRSSFVGEASGNKNRLKFVVIGHKLRDDTALEEALKMYSDNIVFSDTGFDHLMQKQDENKNQVKQTPRPLKTIFVLDNFDGSILKQLVKHNCTVLGPPVIMKSFSCTAKDGSSLALQTRNRPLYNLAMDKITVCIHGFKDKEEICGLANLVHKMGGSVRKEVTGPVTHLITNHTSGDKYRTAVSMGVKIMSGGWVKALWHLKDQIDVTALDLQDQYILKPFANSVLSFHGFPKHEKDHMEKLTLSNGGSYVQAGSPSATHLVLHHSPTSQYIQVPYNVYIVTSEWFWASIQMEASADESMYPGCIGDDDEEEEFDKTPSSRLNTTEGTPGSVKKLNVKEHLAQLANEGEAPCGLAATTLFSINNSLFDLTNDPSNTMMQEGNATHQSPYKLKELTKRQQTILELIQTEMNYVNILRTIIKVFKEQIEKPDQPGGAILDAQKVKIIFGAIPNILDIHHNIKNQLEQANFLNNDNASVGKIFLSNSEKLLKTYPTFINYFEYIKEVIETCQKNQPRFHAFLQLCRSNSECGRQSLTELLIRPVQRLPSISLLLRDLLKRTDDKHPDHTPLQQALHTLESVMKHINEDKRKSEAHQVLFDIINDIENCPANLLSAHRLFQMKTDVTLAGDYEETNKGAPVTFFLFNDSLEICKKRMKLWASKAHHSKSVKVYRHIVLLPFSSIKRIVDVSDANDNSIFALVIKQPNEQEKLLTFSVKNHCHNNNNTRQFYKNSFIRESGASMLSITSTKSTMSHMRMDVIDAFDDIDDEASKIKEELLVVLSKAICTNMCRTDHERLLAAVDSQDLNIDVSDLHSMTLSKKLGKRMSRVFSMNRTPSNVRRVFNSAVQFISPLRRNASNASFKTPSLSAKKPRLTPSIESPISPHHTFTPASSAMFQEPDAFSELGFSDFIDKVSMGTPALQRRRDTLANICFDHQSLTPSFSIRSKRSRNEDFDDDFVAPSSIPLKQRTISNTKCKNNIANSSNPNEMVTKCINNDDFESIDGVYEGSSTDPKSCILPSNHVNNIKARNSEDEDNAVGNTNKNDEGTVNKGKIISYINKVDQI